MSDFNCDKLIKGQNCCVSPFMYNTLILSLKSWFNPIGEQALKSNRVTLIRMGGQKLKSGFGLHGMVHLA